MRPDSTSRATTETWDAVASEVARLVPDMTTEAPLDRAVLAAFVEMVQGSGDGLVAEIGCGSGRVMVHLAQAGVRIVGVDLSPGMVAVGRSTHPELAMAVGNARALPFRSEGLAGLVAWYSLINLPTDLLIDVFGEFARVLQPGAPVVLAFQCGEGERVDRTTAYGMPVPMTYFRHRIEDVARALAEAGFDLHATVQREPSRVHETTRQAFLMAWR